MGLIMTSPLSSLGDVPWPSPCDRRAPRLPARQPLGVDSRTCNPMLDDPGADCGGASSEVSPARLGIWALMSERDGDPR